MLNILLVEESTYKMFIKGSLTMDLVESEIGDPLIATAADKTAAAFHALVVPTSSSSVPLVA
jgi:hypothetical protein